ncbi:PP2C family protein-serine/threonine phosphatase [Candidatus Endoriftia persephonae]|jgi:serine/threonine protein phosphatase PrpC|uniref:Protein phosphatase 2C domain-containing protein n=1 Tax=Candidatus Endoriftia persephonae TaxID=393765 RepID=A0A9J7A208_9GAMM|nr:protein phosphatase 2C domain-containing protein [Candidatus Endoriftia persephone]USF88808.1 protein phosphatase 2C domain-containing protein [Candidatus Endoriftia persephone]
MNGTSTIHWDSAALSHVGKVRKLNEDAYLDRNESGLWVVADGMGGHSSGDMASGMIVERMQQLHLPGVLSKKVDLLEETLLDINHQLLTEAAHRGGNVTIGATVVVMLAHAAHLLLLWAGDSRAYRFRDGELTQLTQDHTQVEELVAGGLLLREDAENHPASNVVTRAVGAVEELYVDMGDTQVEPGDLYLLCSDGLNKEVADREIGEILAMQLPPENYCHRLIDLALDRGARDNVTVVVARADAGPPEQI